jgi:hypothetical protein
MKLDTGQTDEQSLARLGKQASALLKDRRFSELVQLFGYAVAFDRDPISALEVDLDRCLAEIATVAEPASSSGETIRVKYFNPDGWNIVAIVECVCLVSGRFPVLLELVVSVNSGEFHIMIEDVSPA